MADAAGVILEDGDRLEIRMPIERSAVGGWSVPISKSLQVRLRGGPTGPKGDKRGVEAVVGLAQLPEKETAA